MRDYGLTHEADRWQRDRDAYREPGFGLALSILIGTAGALFTFALGVAALLRLLGVV